MTSLCLHSSEEHIAFICRRRLQGQGQGLRMLSCKQLSATSVLQGSHELPIPVRTGSQTCRWVLHLQDSLARLQHVPHMTQTDSIIQAHRVLAGNIDMQMQT